MLATLDDIRWRLIELIVRLIVRFPASNTQARQERELYRILFEQPLAVQCLQLTTQQLWGFVVADALSVPLGVGLGLCSSLWPSRWCWSLRRCPDRAPGPPGGPPASQVRGRSWRRLCRCSSLHRLLGMKANTHTHTLEVTPQPFWPCHAANSAPWSLRLLGVLDVVFWLLNQLVFYVVRGGHRWAAGKNRPPAALTTHTHRVTQTARGSSVSLLQHIATHNNRRHQISERSNVVSNVLRARWELQSRRTCRGITNQNQLQVRAAKKKRRKSRVESRQGSTFCM